MSMLENKTTPRFSTRVVSAQKRSSTTKLSSSCDRQNCSIIKNEVPTTPSPTTKMTRGPSFHQGNTRHRDDARESNNHQKMKSLTVLVPHNHRPTNHDDETESLEMQIKHLQNQIQLERIMHSHEKQVFKRIETDLKRQITSLTNINEQHTPHLLDLHCHRRNELKQTELCFEMEMESIKSHFAKQIQFWKQEAMEAKSLCNDIRAQSLVHFETLRNSILRNGSTVQMAADCTLSNAVSTEEDGGTPLIGITEEDADDNGNIKQGHTENGSNNVNHLSGENCFVRYHKEGDAGSSNCEKHREHSLNYHEDRCIGEEDTSIHETKWKSENGAANHLCDKGGEKGLTFEMVHASDEDDSFIDEEKPTPTANCEEQFENMFVPPDSPFQEGTKRKAIRNEETSSLPTSAFTKKKKGRSSFKRRTRIIPPELRKQNISTPQVIKLTENHEGRITNDTSVQTKEGTYHLSPSTAEQSVKTGPKRHCHRDGTSGNDNTWCSIYDAEDDPYRTPQHSENLDDDTTGTAHLNTNGQMQLRSTTFAEQGNQPGGCSSRAYLREHGLRNSYNLDREGESENSVSENPDMTRSTGHEERLVKTSMLLRCTPESNPDTVFSANNDAETLNISKSSSRVQKNRPAPKRRKKIIPPQLRKKTTPPPASSVSVSATREQKGR